MNQQRELLEQNIELSDLIEEIADAAGFDKIRDLYVRQARQMKANSDRSDKFRSVLRRLTEKVERAESLVRSGGSLKAEDWKELRVLVTEARKEL